MVQQHPDLKDVIEEEPLVVQNNEEEEIPIKEDQEDLEPEEVIQQQDEHQQSPQVRPQLQVEINPDKGTFQEEKNVQGNDL